MRNKIRNNFQCRSIRAITARYRRGGSTSGRDSDRRGPGASGSYSLDRHPLNTHALIILP